MAKHDQEGRLRKRLGLLVLSVSLVMGALASTVAGAGNSEQAAEAHNGIELPVEIYETVSDNGLVHPGVGLTKPILENVRTQVLAQQEPWYSYYKEMSSSPSASKTVTSSNQSAADPTRPNTDAFNSQGVQALFKADATKAYTQALMYIITGDETYRANAMHIIRIWSQMDPAKYAPYPDAHIHSGYPLNRMVTAAELMRYSSNQSPELTWTNQDTEDFTNHLVEPIIRTYQSSNHSFMNQNNFSIVGSMAGFIFTNNRAGYDQRVEWFTVNKTARDQGFNGSIKQLFRWIDTNAITGEALPEPRVQLVEMGRDQAHGGDDLQNAVVIPRMIMAQGTKVDPVEGTVSTTAEAVGPYEFLNDRILAGADYYSRYMLGYDTPWTPVPYAISADGTVRGIYRQLSDAYRGRLKTNLYWDLYYYYTYVRGVDVSEKAPYFYESFVQRNPMKAYYRGESFNAWESYDGGGDSFWLYIPAEAAIEGSQHVPAPQPNAAIMELEERYTDFSDRSTTQQEGDTAYIRVEAVPEGSQLAWLNLSYSERSKSRLIGLKFRTNGPVELEMSRDADSEPYHRLALPDTNGEWRYITYDMGIHKVSYGQLDNDYSIAYVNIVGNGTIVDLDHLQLQVNRQLTPPVFDIGDEDQKVIGYVGAPLMADFSASDAASQDTVIYRAAGTPAGVELDPNTGQLSWQSPQAGTYNFIVEAHDGVSIATLRVELHIAENRTAAMNEITDRYDSSTSYVTTSLTRYQEALQDTLSLLSTANDSEFNAQLELLKKAVDGLEPLSPLLADGSLDYTQLVASNAKEYLSMLADGNGNTYPVYSLASASNYILDFGPNYHVQLDAFAMQGRMNFVDRMAGTAVFGSNDGENWSRLSTGETQFVDEISKVEIDSLYRDSSFRYLKFEKVTFHPDILGGNKSALYEPSELRIYGQRIETDHKLTSIAIGSPNNNKGRIVTGDVANVTIQAKEPIYDVTVAIQGVSADVYTTDNMNFIASAVMDVYATSGQLSFTIDYKRADNSQGDTTTATTDGSTLYLVHPEQRLDVKNIATVTASDAQWGSGGLSKDEVGYLLFDGNTSTFGDLKTAAGSFYTLDFGEDTAVQLDTIALMPRASYAGRVNGLIIQGSNDGTNWTPLTRAFSGASEVKWYYIQRKDLLDFAEYRYFRLYNHSSWSGNLAEVELYGSIQTP